jgi:hypothetical protein
MKQATPTPAAGPRAPGRTARAAARVGLALAALFGLTALAVEVASCSAGSELAGNGACDGYCTKAAGLACIEKPDLNRCVAACVAAQGRCPRTMSELMRCAANEGLMVCDSNTLGPRVVNCGNAQADRDDCISRANADAGVPEAGSLPIGL